MCKCNPVELSSAVPFCIDNTAIIIMPPSSCRKRNVKEARLVASTDETNTLLPPSVGLTTTPTKKRRLSVTVEAPVSMQSSHQVSSNFPTTRLDTPETRPLPSKRVTFSDEPHIVIGSSDTQRSLEDLSRVWYQRSEMAMIKRMVRDHVLKTLLSSSSSSSDCCQLDDDDDSTRGLERYNIDRARQKSLARKITLIASATSGLTDEDVASIAQKCSSSAGEQAMWMGCIDFCTVYLPNIDLAKNVFPQHLHRIVQQQQQL